MKIAVLISGGVDSAVALRLLKEQGHDLTAFYLKIWLEDELSFLGDCPWEQDLKYVRKICEEIHVPLEIIPMQKEYFDEVVNYTISEVKAGRTPNPDVLCNNRIKFGLFLKRIGKEFEKVASGHYAQTIEKNGHVFLKKAPDPIKDQTYFLANLKQKQLKRIVFPIGHLNKNEVRKLAHKFDLINKDRKDSQGICFLGKIKYRDFINHYLKEKTGDLIDFDSNEKVGEHRGYWFYTIGQRKDIRLPGGPYYVVDKDSKKNIIYVSKNYDAKDKERKSFDVSDLNWFAGEFPKKQGLNVKIRHGENEYKCKISSVDKNLLHVEIQSNDQGIAEGQFAVFYDGNNCLGSGIIS